MPRIYNLPVPIPHSPDTDRLRWARQLQRWGLASLVSSLLDTHPALATLAAQSLYIGQPLISTWVPREDLHDLAGLLEDRQQAAEFSRLLQLEAQ